MFAWSAGGMSAQGKKFPQAPRRTARQQWREGAGVSRARRPRWKVPIRAIRFRLPRVNAEGRGVMKSSVALGIWRWYRTRERWQRNVCCQV